MDARPVTPKVDTLFVSDFLANSAIAGFFGLRYPTDTDYKLLKAELMYLHTSAIELNKEYLDGKECREEILHMLQNGVFEEKYLYGPKCRKNGVNKLQDELFEALHAICNIDSNLREAIHLYDADKIGLIDYALESSGAAIISTPNTTPVKSKFDSGPSSDPAAIIQPGILPGQCFGFEGHSGTIRIMLREKVIVNSVALEHTHKQLTSDFRSAPKDFHIYGLSSPDDPRGDKLGEFVYNIKAARQLQMFKVDNTVRAYQYIELRILTNYGHPEHTCVYRLRVHSYT